MVIAGQFPIILRAARLRLWWMSNLHPNLSRVEQQFKVLNSPWALKSKNSRKSRGLASGAPLPRILTEPTENPDGSEKGY